jgi:hypothetical protein
MAGYYWRTDRIARRWFYPAAKPLIGVAAALGLLSYPLTCRLMQACHYRYSTYRWVP